MGETIEAFDGVLIGSAVTTITFVGTYLGVEIESVSGTTAIFYTADGSAPSTTTSAEIAAVAGKTARVIFDAAVAAPVVKLLSSGTPTYSVIGLDASQVQSDASLA